MWGMKGDGRMRAQKRGFRNVRAARCSVAVQLLWQRVTAPMDRGSPACAEPREDPAGQQGQASLLSPTAMVGRGYASVGPHGVLQPGRSGRRREGGETHTRRTVDHPEGPAHAQAWDTALGRGLGQPAELGEGEGGEGGGWERPAWGVPGGQPGPGPEPQAARRPGQLRPHTAGAGATRQQGSRPRGATYTEQAGGPQHPGLPSPSPRSSGCQGPWALGWTGGRA